MNKIVLILILLNIANLTLAQSKKDTVLLDQIVIVTPYTPTLSDAKKEDIKPEIEDFKAETPIFDYQVKEKQYRTGLVANSAAPEIFKNTFVQEAKNIYAKLGGGNYGTLLGEVFLHNKYNPNFDYGMSYKHLSANAQNSVQDFSNNYFSAYGTRMYKQSEFNASIGYDRNKYNYFARINDSFLNKSTPYHLFETFALHTHYIKKPFKERGVHTSMFFDFRNLGSNLQLNESLIDAGISFKKKVLGGIAELPFKVNNQNVETENKKFTQTTIWSMPRFTFKSKQYDLNITLGLNFALSIDSNKKYPLYPNPFINIEKILIPDLVTGFAGLDGNVEVTKLKDLMYNNPFLTNQKNIIIKNKYTPLNIFLGAKGRITSATDFKFTLSISDIKNMPLWIMNNDSLRGFHLIYDDVSINNLKVEINHSLGEKLRLYFKGSFSTYNTSVEEKAWQLPNALVEIKGNYNIKRKYYLSASVNFIGDRYNKTYNISGNQLIKSIADFNVGFEYKFYKRFSAFINGNNLASARYLRWYNYPSYGFNILGGVTASF